LARDDEKDAPRCCSSEKGVINDIDPKQAACLRA